MTMTTTALMANEDGRNKQENNQEETERRPSVPVPVSMKGVKSSNRESTSTSYIDMQMICYDLHDVKLDYRLLSKGVMNWNRERRPFQRRGNIEAATGTGSGSDETC